MKELLDSLKIYAKENKIPIMLDDTAEFLEILILSSRPGKVLEIGTAIGYSAIRMAGALDHDGRIETIEVNQEMVHVAWKNISDAGLKDVIRIIEGDAGEILPHLTEEYDMIFLDAAKSRYMEFLPHCVRLLKNKGLLISDNVLYKGLTKGPEWVRHKQRTAVTKLREYLNVLEEHPLLKTVLLPIGDGVTISVKEAT